MKFISYLLGDGLRSTTLLITFVLYEVTKGVNYVDNSTAKTSKTSNKPDTNLSDQRGMVDQNLLAKKSPMTSIWLLMAVDNRKELVTRISCRMRYNTLKLRKRFMTVKSYEYWHY